MAADPALAGLSNTLVYSAMVAYTGALVTFAADLSGRSGPGRRERSRDVVRSVAPVRARTRSRTLVPAGPGPGPSPTSRSGAHPGAASGSGPGSERGPATGAGPGRATVAPDRVPIGRSTAAGIAVSLTVLATFLHGGAVLARGLSVHRAPWGNMYEFALAGTAVVAATYLLVLTRRDLRYLGTFVVGPVLLVLGLAITVLYTAAGQLVPALHSFWLYIHVSVAFIASALFTLGASVTVLQLAQHRRESARARGRNPRRGATLDALPPSTELEHTAHRLHVIAFPLWTFTVIAGAIWAEAAWGRYWNWDPKEVWSFVIWVVYAGYLHARATRGWDGSRAALLALAGYACLLFNFAVVNLLFVGLHSYAGV
ncbi:MAG: c-type cytochrome biogenesis protein CcsB [Kineosporiaceae bacterium]